MSKTKHVTIQNKIATYDKADGFIVCANESYEIEFSFDAEWDAYPDKKAKFIVYTNGRYEGVAVPFSGNICPVPAVYNTTILKVGVYVENVISTTTAAEIPCKLSILCGKVKNISGFGSGTGTIPSGGASYDDTEIKKDIAKLYEELEKVRGEIGGGVGNVDAEGILNEAKAYTDKSIENIPKEIVNITSIDTVYNTVADLPTNAGNGTTLLVSNEKALYTYDGDSKKWVFKVELRPHTAYIVLSGEKSGIYRYTMSAPYLVTAEENAVGKANAYTDAKIGDIDTALDAIIELQNSLIDEEEI